MLHLTATPRNGAMQGVATTVARTPEKKLPHSQVFGKDQNQSCKQTSLSQKHHSNLIQKEKVK